jgi:hypothetical protein
MKVQTDRRSIDVQRPTRRIAATISILMLGAGSCMGQTTTAPAARRSPEASFTHPVEKKVSKPYRGLTIEYHRYEAPRPLRAWIATVSLETPGLEVLATCGSDVGPEFETRCETTLTFAERRGVQLAVNASAFHPFRQKAGDPMQVVGLGACDGAVYSPPDPRFGALILRKNGKLHIGMPPYEVEKIDEAVSGFHMLIEDGRDVVARSAQTLKPGFVGVNPRTAVGIDKKGHTLWLAVFDGRQKGVSEGMTLHELGRFFGRLGAHQALNLDGGGSTTMVLQDAATGAHRVLNTPMGRTDPATLRLVANNLGVKLPSDKAPPARP